MSSTARGGVRIENDVYETPAWSVHRLLDHLARDGFSHRMGSCNPLRALYGGHTAGGALPRWLEPCAGRGNIIRAVASWAEARGLVEPLWTAAEIRPACAPILRALPGVERVWTGDWLARDEAPNQFDVDLTNPPFVDAMAFIRHCRPLAIHTFKLLRLNFLGSEERSDFIRATRPDLYILPNRPEFAMSVKCNGDGKPIAQRKIESCGWKDVLPLSDPRPTTCPQCSVGGVQISTTDSIEYAWFHWHPDASSRYTMLASTSKEEREVCRHAA